MTISEYQSILRDRVREIAARKFSTELDQIAAEVPPKTELGDLAFPVAFELAKLIKRSTGEKQNPRAIAEDIKAELESFDFVDRVEIAGPGYLNIFYDRVKFLSENLTAEPLPGNKPQNAASPKVCVEHTSVNPNKAAHIGHVRNSVIGDTFVRILKATGKRVEIQNYIDNTGVQVADVVVGFMFIENMNLEAIKALDKELATAGHTFDYYCWDLYTRVGKEYQENEELKQKRAEVLHLIEEGGNETAELADYVATRNVECILATMERFGIRYDLLPRESEILHLHFWDRAFERMKELGVIHFESEGKNAGCWVMPFEEHSGTDEHESDKILVRSNGTVTYTGKDIAYQMWKLGILGMDFLYRPFHKYADGRVVWITTADKDQAEDAPEFGNGEAVYNVIDTRQSYPQEIVRKGVAAIDPERGESASVHLSYEMVALSPAAAEELGFELSEEDRKRPFIEMSGRKGLGVKADDLLDRLEANALLEVESRHPDLADDEKRDIANRIAVGALRYFLLKFTRTTVIVFDFKEALSFEGETGCFCQYSAVRANSIFRKLSDRGESLDAVKAPLQDAEAAAAVFEGEGGDDIWSMLMLASRLEETVRQASAANEPAILAKYTFNLAKAFNLFYHHHKILPEPDPAKRAVLISVADAARRSLTAALATMGISVPERM
ncbi:MAG TPA: arginine--tRNA ligase [Pyrinomonadaceae bacterium]|nr:arginine--tRNA ligase [Pyrinomonadaceae bacterium]